MQPAFHYYYACTAVRRFMFFLDPKRMGKVRIADIMASGFLDDLLQLRDTQQPINSNKSVDETPPTTTDNENDEEGTLNHTSARSNDGSNNAQQDNVSLLVLAGN